MAKLLSVFAKGPDPIDSWWFSFDRDNPLTVFYGKNGAGKTTLLRTLSIPGKKDFDDSYSIFEGIEMIFQPSEEIWTFEFLVFLQLQQLLTVTGTYTRMRIVNSLNVSQAVGSIKSLSIEQTH